MLISIVIVCILINGLLNTVWIILTVKKAAIAIIPTRVVKQLIMIPIMFITMLSLLKLLEKQIRGLND